jgi:hypothetical protein
MPPDIANDRPNAAAHNDRILDMVLSLDRSAASGVPQVRDRAVDV